MLSFWAPLTIGLGQAFGTTLTLSRDERVQRLGTLCVAMASVVGAVWLATAPLLAESAQRRG